MEEIKAFYTPLPFLIKADPKDPNIIYLEASNTALDTQGDVVMQKALEDEAESFLKKGVLSWDHLHKIEKSPEFIVGEPLDIRFDENKTWVKGKLYKAVKYAEAIRDLISSQCSRLGASVGGYIKARKQLSKSLSAIISIIWDELAITYKPVNELTRGQVTMITPEAFAKALMAGAGVDAASFTGGRALIPESLQGVKRKDLKRIVTNFQWRLEKGAGS